MYIIQLMSPILRKWEFAGRFSIYSAAIGELTRLLERFAQTGEQVQVQMIREHDGFVVLSAREIAKIYNEHYKQQEKSHGTKRTFRSRITH